MEYFKGLLFLTTNRVGQIDDAFISRVHVAIEYPALTIPYRDRIWKAFFTKLHTERKGKIKVSPRAQAYVLGREMELNGREIRNAKILKGNTYFLMPISCSVTSISVY